MLARALKRSWSDRSIGPTDCPAQTPKQPRLDVRNSANPASVVPLCQKPPAQNSKKEQREQREQKGVRLCKCRKSKCLKLYCECFAAGSFCGTDCLCTDCGNTYDNPEAIARARDPRP